MNTKLIIIVYTCLLCKIIKSSPFDDGKYSPGKYSPDDGKYYRPKYEGKYIPTDEGKYTYIYRQGIYPTDNRDYRYQHVTGPDGSGSGPDGSNGPDGSYDPYWNEYIGYKIYADKYPYVHDVIKALVDEFVSKNYILDGDGSQVNENIYNKIRPNEMDGMSAMKCQYLQPNQNESDIELKQSEAIMESLLEKITESLTTVSSSTTEEYVPESTTDSVKGEYNLFENSLPRIYPQKGEDIGEFYNFKGLKSALVLSDDKHTKKKIKLQYEITIRVIDEVS